MILQQLILLFLSLRTCSVLCVYCGQLYSDCGLHWSSNHLGAGKPSQQAAECKYNEADDTFYQQISWKPPLGAPLNVSAYFVKVLYWRNCRFCFNFNATVHSFRFDASKGFKGGRIFWYAVIPQPVRGGRVRSQLHQSIQCPPKLKLKEIGNKYIKPGSNTTFECVFETRKIHMLGERYYKPVLNFTVNWYFSGDFNCSSSRRILIQNSEHFRLSDDHHMLNVIRAKPQHQGCYLLHVEHASGNYYNGTSAQYRERYSTLQARSYLYMNNNTKFPKFVQAPTPSNRYLCINMQLFVMLVVGAVVGALFVVISFTIMIRLCFRKHNFYSSLRPQNDL